MVDPKQVPSVELNNGVSIPIVGLGTWQSPPDGSLYKAVSGAIDAGYRHIDCAYAYENEEEVGKAINDAISAGKVSFKLKTKCRKLIINLAINLAIYSYNFVYFYYQVKREDLFIVSKVWLCFFRRDRVQLCVKKILSKLNTPYLDLCLIHWPMSFGESDTELLPVGADGIVIDGKIDYLEAWQGLEDCVKAGLVKSIGISNFNTKQIERLLGSATIKPVTNQVEPFINELSDRCLNCN